jgi:hypothetical protein
MKQKLFSLTLLAITLFSFTTLGDPEKDILGKWKIEDGYAPKAVKNMIEFMRKTNPDQAEQMEQANDQLLEMFNGLTLEYKADKTYEVDIPGQGAQGGKWEMGADKKSILVTRSNGTQRTDKIIELTDKKLVILNGERQDTTRYTKQ